MTRLWASIAGGIGAIISHAVAYFKGKSAGKREALDEAARKAVKRKDADALLDVIKESHD